MPRLIWVFTGRTLILLVLSCWGSLVHSAKTQISLPILAVRSSLNALWVATDPIVFHADIKGWSDITGAEPDPNVCCRHICSIIIIQNEPAHGKSNKITCVLSEDSDQPRHPPSLIRDFAACMKNLESLAILGAHGVDSDQPARKRSLIWGFVLRTYHFGFVVLRIKSFHLDYNCIK